MKLWKRARLRLRAWRLGDEPDLESELEFWDEHLAAGRRHAWMDGVLDPERRRQEFPEVVLPYLERLRSRHEGAIRALDVGCGPISPLAWGVDQGLLELTAVDPLADEYIRLLENHGIRYPVVPRRGAGEDLADLFEAESFDLVYSRNALDHAVDVRRCIENATRVLRPGGFLVLEGFVREGTRTHWTGLHQHDLVPADGELLRFDKKGRATRLTAGLGLRCLHQEQTGDAPKDWYKMAFEKIEAP